ncbi:NADH-quinone oxidoreductase subunit N [Natronoglycomyces albus]|uniref:NADH-quinone oxidoreductase subunit N n=1 Tax=Natronoglycomyces albus TaxID=2811108 RepID=A0A895XRK6_9ACTN|nr:proton-conducting transporter membrane subunit [Natronoglycomyces albus]QSB05815.1 NADH-quinone oxidoreductase subunit N [Natronoglycomyces albus]
MEAQAINHLALLPAYIAAATAVLVLVLDLLWSNRRALSALAALGVAATGAAAIWLGAAAEGLDGLVSFPVAGHFTFVLDRPAIAAVVVFAALTLLTVALSARFLATAPLGSEGERPFDPAAESKPVGEYLFLLMASFTGAVVLASSRDLITIIIAVETVTLPLYILVSLRGDRASTEAGVTYLIASVTTGATALMGAAILYAAAGTVHLSALDLSEAHPALVAAGVALLIGGLAFKIAAAPLHAWAPLVYDRAPLPVVTYLASASKLAGAVAIIWITYFGLASAPLTVGTILVALSLTSILVGNLGALSQRRTVRLFAWSSVAHAGYLLAPLAALVTLTGRADPALAAAAAFAYAVFFVLMEATALTVLTAIRGDNDGGFIRDLSGLWHQRPGSAALLAVAVAGLAGLPPGMAGLFAKVAILQWLAGASVGLAIAVIVGTAIGLVYYLRLLRTILIGAPSNYQAHGPTLAVAVVAGIMLLAIGFLPELVLSWAQFG